MSDERWKPVVGYETNYEVSNYGRVRSRRRKGARGGVVAPAIREQFGHGYALVQLSQDGKPKSFYVHQLVAEAFIGPRPEGAEGEHIRHRDGDGLNNMAYNLAYGSAAENNRDVQAMGRNANANKTHCPQGHPYTEENTKRTATGRRCRVCLSARRRARYLQIGA